MSILNQVKAKSILVVGDVMLDTYYNGEVTRISPEAPVPVFRKVSEQSVLGGAANVAANLVAAGQKVSILTIVGEDESGKKLLQNFADKKIDIIRVGLQNTEEIAEPGTKESEVVAGPYHPAFRQLVESGMWYDAIVGKIKKLNMKVKEVEVTVSPIDANNVIGHKKENVQKLKDTYDVDLILKQDENMKQGKSKVEITKTYDN